MSSMPLGKRVTVEGTVRKINRKYNDITGETKFIMNVVGRDWQMWGTLPILHVDDIGEGDKVSFEADVDTGSSEHYGYFRRPRKMQRVDVTD